MKTATDHKAIKSSGIEAKPVSFSMLATAEAFEVWSDGLYPNKIKAILRELGTNAIDGTVQKHREKHPNLDITKDVIAGLTPFTVHLPTRFEPWFSNRDYGVGLGYSVVPHQGDNPDVQNTMFTGTLAECKSYIKKLDPAQVKYKEIKICDDVVTMYATYFYSNKCKSNDFTGCLGLGSKSPFAYTDNFCVTVWHGGFKRVYNAVIDNGFPSIVPVQEPVASDEPSGMEIKFATKDDDASTFVGEAEGLYEYFVLKPEITGNTEVTIEPVDYSIEGKNWGIRRDSDESGPRAIMGSIAYPIEKRHLRDLSESESRILSTDVDIYFNIGDLQITPSRESLSYKQTTIGNIKSMLHHVSQDMVISVNKSFSDCKTLWAARCLARKFFYGHYGTLSQLGRLVSIKDISWRGQKLGSAEIVLRHHSKGDIISGIECYHFCTQEKRGSWSGETTVKRHKNPASFAPDEDIVFVNMDLPVGSFSRCENAVRNDNDNYGAVICIRFDTKKAKKEFISLTGLDGSEFIEASSLPKAVRNPSTGTRYKNTAQVFEHKGSGRHGHRQHDYWESTEIDLEDGGVFVEVCRYSVNHYGVDGGEHPRELGALMVRMEHIGHPIKVIGVRSKLAKKFRESDDWVDVWTYAKNVFNNLLVKGDLETDISNALEFNSFSNRDKFDKVSKYVTTGGPRHSLFARFIDTLKILQKSSKKIKETSKYTELASSLGINLQSKCAHDLDDMEETLRSIYPMLKVAFGRTHYYYGRGDDTNYKDIGDYISLVDSVYKS